jgi:flavin-dependent dehydrogenase
VKPRHGLSQDYEFLAVATGVNTNALRLFKPITPGFQPPRLVQTFVREYHLGKEKIESFFGHHAIHFFLLDLPGLDFGAIVPKGNYATVCLLGDDLSEQVVETFMNAVEVKNCMPPGWNSEEFVCHCSPRINLTGAIHPYADRMVFIGDSGISRLYKDGLGAAYRAAKVAAATAIFHGISEEDFRWDYWRSCRVMEFDNLVGKFIFAVVRLIKPHRFVSRAMVRMVDSEQAKPAAQRRMSRVMWDMFTGSAPYREIFMNILHPSFWSRWLWCMATSLGRRDGWKRAN